MGRRHRRETPWSWNERSDVHIKSLRKKLGDAADLIETVRGVGYRFHEPRLVES